MGISIHFSGQIDRLKEIDRLVEELADIAKSIGWASQRINEGEPDPDFRGIIVNPEGDCEPLVFLFDRQGRLRGLMDLLTAPAEPGEETFSTSTKTQFAETQTHVWIVGLLRYLKRRYIQDLSVKDEGGYWETEDLGKLREKKRFLEGMIDRISGELKASSVPRNAPTGEIISEIEAILRRIRPGEGDRREHE